ncbi:hypothetical protein [Nocardia sp. NBC_01009]|uniref:hypothetical protein n=1 Tax=Nocardia sp. NBC_01009 TaxID=2975996 RepID=UPI00386C5B09|nr:hypothetical protein OHA42_06540 [Nocardia sp. NBC_01009]
MVQPTPWQANKIRYRKVDTPSTVQRIVSQRREEVAKVLASLRGNWGYLCAAVGSIITFRMLFKPWLTASGTDGQISADPFGGLQISTSLASLWSGSPPPAADVNGTWGVLASTASAVTVFAVLVNLRARTKVLSYVAVGSSVTLALLIVIVVAHLNSKAADVKRMVGYGSARDAGTQVGLLVRWATGNGQYPVPGMRQVAYATASLTTWAWLAGAISLISALIAIAQWIRGRTTGPAA